MKTLGKEEMADFVVVITIGRTGSTLLNGFLNALNGVLVRGENFMFPYYLFCASRSISNAVKHGRSETTSAWFGSNELDEKEFIKWSREILVAQLFGESANREEIRLIGFKEIRFIDLDYEEIRSFIDYLSVMFPGVRFIFHSRDYSHVAESSWWRFYNPTLLFHRFEEFEACIREISLRENSPPFLFTEYETMVTDPLIFADTLANFLNVTYESEKILQVAREVHSDVTENQLPLQLRNKFPSLLPNLQRDW